MRTFFKKVSQHPSHVILFYGMAATIIIPILGLISNNSTIALWQPISTFFQNGDAVLDYFNYAFATTFCITVVTVLLQKKVLFLTIPLALSFVIAFMLATIVASDNVLLSVVLFTVAYIVLFTGVYFFFVHNASPVRSP